LDSKELGIELARLIEDTLDETIPDVSNTLGKQPWEILFEYIAFLLWIATKETSAVLPKKFIQPTIDYMSFAIFLHLRENANFSRLFNERKWKDFVINRCELYYWAWNFCRIELEIEDEDEEVSKSVGMCFVAHNFVLSCFAKAEEDLRKVDAKYKKLPPKKCAAHLEGVLFHYHRFLERMKSVLPTETQRHS